MINFLKNKKLFAIAVIVVVVAAVAFFFNQSSSAILRVTTNPTSASVYIDENLMNGTFVKLKKGNHTIRVYKEDYLEQSRKITLTKSTNIKISLLKKDFSEFQKKSDLINLTSPFYTDGGFASLNPDKGSLFVLNDNFQTVDEIVLPENLKALSTSFGGWKILIISDLRYFVYDIQKKLLSEINLSEYEPILSMTLTKDGEILISGKYQVSGNLSNVYLFNSDTKTGKQLSKNAPANFIIPLNNSKLLFIQTQDAANGSSASLFDTAGGFRRTIIQKPDFIENPVPHPQKTLLAYLGSSGLTLLDYEKSVGKSLLESTPEQIVFSWINDSDLIVGNVLKNTVFIVNTESNSISQEVELPKMIGKWLISIEAINSTLYYYYLDINTNQLSVYSAPLTQP